MTAEGFGIVGMTAGGSGVSAMTTGGSDLGTTGLESAMSTGLATIRTRTYVRGT